MMLIPYLYVLLHSWEPAIVDRSSSEVAAAWDKVLTFHVRLVAVFQVPPRSGSTPQLQWLYVFIFICITGFLANSLY
jgi:hypothetical protein